MPLLTPEVKNFEGLYLQANSFSQVPDGGLEIAKNVVISNDRKILKRRGFYQYYDPSTDTPVSLFNYQDRLMLVNTDSIGYFTDTGANPNETGTKTALSGVTVATNQTDKSRSGQFNSNLYFTTENGVLKIETFDGTILESGVAPALDLRGKFISGSAISSTSAVGYRLVYGRRDANDRLYLGAPSDFLVLDNSGGTSQDVELEFSIPSELTSTAQGWFWQLYRSSQVTSGSTPPLDYKLIKEQKLTTAEIARGVVYYTDSIADLFLGAELYTNPNSREGETQANAKAPKCKDITVYKNHVIYGNTVSRHLLYLDIVDPDQIANGDHIEFQIGSNQYKFVANTDATNEPAANQTVAASSVSGTGTITITYNNHNFANGYEVYISNVTGTVPEGLYTISGVTTNTFDISSSGNSASALDFEGRTDGTDPIFWVDRTSSAAVKLRNTAVHLAKAVNRDDNTPIYGRYISLPTGVPGKASFQAEGFGDAIEIKASSSGVGSAFDPTLPTTYDDSVLSSNDDLPHGFYSSKISEPEAVPTTNFFTAGSRIKQIQRVVALRDSLIILKEDGIFRVTGDTVSSFTITTLDNTVFCIAPDSVAVINNQIVFLSNQGFCLVTESSVQIISRKIEDVITPRLGISTLSAETNAVADESERIYLVSTLEPNGSTASIVYCYNTLTDAWTTWDNTFDNGVVGPGDTLFLVESDEIIRKERKKQTRLDYSAQNYEITVNSVSSDLLSANITTTGGLIPEVGDIILKNDVFTRLDSVSVSGANYDVTFDNATNLVATDTENLYSRYESLIKFAPFHAGKISMMKHFSQIQLHLGSLEITRIDLNFTGNYFGGSDTVEWSRVNVLAGSSSGWGYEPWGFFTWGLTDGIDLITGSQPATIVRTYIPRFQARNTFIQPVLKHVQAGEKLNLQAIGYTLRPYGERVSK